MLSVILIAGRWAGEKHPEAVTPDAWTRDIAAEYVADTMTRRSFIIGCRCTLRVSRWEQLYRPLQYVL
jgi:hypothetical protein